LWLSGVIGWAGMNLISGVCALLWLGRDGMAWHSVNGMADQAEPIGCLALALLEI